MLSMSCLCYFLAVQSTDHCFLYFCFGWETVVQSLVEWTFPENIQRFKDSLNPDSTPMIETNI